MVRFDADAALQAVEQIVPLIAEQAAASEAAGRLTQPVLDALHRERLFRLLVPRQYEGGEADLISALRVFEAIAHADGAAGWSVMIGAGAGFFGGFLEPNAAREIFREDTTVIAGSGAASGTAVRVAGGYRVKGRWSYASGAHHANWFTANCKVAGDRQDSSGAARVIAVAVPAGDVRIHETWDVSGMRGTGSEDIEIDDSFVPAEFTFSAANGTPRVDSPLYRVPFLSLAAFSFAAVALGVARHGIDAFTALALQKRSFATGRLLADDEDAQIRLARAEAAVRAARAHVYTVAEDLWHAVEAGRAGEQLELMSRICGVDTVHRCAAAVDSLVARAGMAPLQIRSELGRAGRDLDAMTQNMVVSADVYRDCGRSLFGVP